MDQTVHKPPLTGNKLENENGKSKKEKKKKNKKTIKFSGITSSFL